MTCIHETIFNERDEQFLCDNDAHPHGVGKELYLCEEHDVTHALEQYKLRDGSVVSSTLEQVCSAGETHYIFCSIKR